MKVYVIFDKWDGRFEDVWATRRDAEKRLQELVGQDNYFIAEFKVREFNKESD